MMNDALPDEQEPEGGLIYMRAAFSALILLPGTTRFRHYMHAAQAGHLLLYALE